MLTTVNLSVITYFSYDHTCQFGDEVYATKKEAEDEAAKYPDTSNPLKVMALDDYIDTVKSEQRNLGRIDEMESNRAAGCDC